MDRRFQDLPESESEYLLLIAMYKTRKELIWGILHRWYKLHGLPNAMSASEDQPITMQYYYRFLVYIKDN